MDNYERLLALPRFCSIRQTSDFLEVSPSTVKRFIEEGDLVAWRLESGRRKVDRDSIARLCGLTREATVSGKNIGISV